MYKLVQGYTHTHTCILVLFGDRLEFVVLECDTEGVLSGICLLYWLWVEFIWSKFKDL